MFWVIGQFNVQYKIKQNSPYHCLESTSHHSFHKYLQSLSPLSPARFLTPPSSVHTSVITVFERATLNIYCDSNLFIWHGLTVTLCPHHAISVRLFSSISQKQNETRWGFHSQKWSTPCPKEGPNRSRPLQPWVICFWTSLRGGWGRVEVMLR